MVVERNIQYEIKRPGKTRGAGKRALFRIQKVTYDGDRRTQITDRTEEQKAKSRARRKAYYDANSEMVKAKARVWRSANREKVNAEKRAYRDANPE